jgi:hypothetical protein
MFTKSTSQNHVSAMPTGYRFAMASVIDDAKKKGQDAKYPSPSNFHPQLSLRVKGQLISCCWGSELTFRLKAEEYAHDAKLKAESLGHDAKLRAEDAKAKGTSPLTTL